MAVNKKHFYKVYDKDDVYITTWGKADVISTPSFSWSINGGMGEMVVTLARASNNFGETSDVAMFNRVETYIQDAEAINGVRIHSGFVSGYTINVSSVGVETVDISILSYTSKADTLIFQDASGNTTIDYTNQDPADIMKDILNKMSNTITYNSDSINTTGNSTTYTFKYSTYLEAINKVIEFSPSYWFWYVDANDILYMKQSDFDTIDHELFVGKHVSSIQLFKTIENLYNRVYFLGGDVADVATYVKHESAASVTENGARDLRVTDTNVTDTVTAQDMSDKILDEQDHFEQSLKCTVLDNNGSDGQIGGIKGYDIESIKPGDVMIIKKPQNETKETLWYNDSGSSGNFVWDVSAWDFDIKFSLGLPMQVQQIDYNFNSADITLSTKLTDLSTSVDDLERELLSIETDTIPDAPS